MVIKKILGVFYDYLFRSEFFKKNFLQPLFKCPRSKLISTFKFAASKKKLCAYQLMGNIPKIYLEGGRIFAGKIIVSQFLTFAQAY
jgi:hypothetical protein